MNDFLFALRGVRTDENVKTIQYLDTSFESIIIAINTIPLVVVVQYSFIGVIVVMFASLWKAKHLLHNNIIVTNMAIYASIKNGKKIKSERLVAGDISSVEVHLGRNASIDITTSSGMCYSYGGSEAELKKIETDIRSLS